MQAKPPSHQRGSPYFPHLDDKPQSFLSPASGHCQVLGCKDLREAQLSPAPALWPAVLTATWVSTVHSCPKDSD